MIILYQNILFPKEFLAYNGCFGLFTKIKDLRPKTKTSFWCTFSAWFFQMFLISTLSMDKVSVPYLFCFSRYQRKFVFSSYLDDWWRYKLLDLSLMTLKSNEQQGEKERRMEIEKFEYLEKGKNFLDEINIFQSF